MNDYPKMLYKKGGSTLIDKEYCSTIIVLNSEEESEQRLNGFGTLYDLKSEKVEEPVVEEPVDFLGEAPKKRGRRKKEK